MATYSIYLTIPHYNDYDAVTGVSYRHTGRRYVTKELALKIAARLGAQDEYDAPGYVVVQDGDRAFRPVYDLRPVNLDDCPF